MAVSDHVPFVEEGNIRRKVVVGLCYLILFPFVVLALPFWLLYAIGTNRNGLGDALQSSGLGSLPMVRRGGWMAGFTVFVVAIVVVGGIFLAVPIDDGNGVGEDPFDEATPTPTAPEVTPSPTPPDPTPTDPTPTPSDTPIDTPTPTPTPDQPVVDGELTVHYLDVGQADSTIIELPNDEIMVIDTGDWRQDGAAVIDYLESMGVERIDHLVATHPHADHIGGHAAVIEHFEENYDGIGAVYDSGVPHDTQTYENYIEVLETYEPTVYEVQEGDHIDAGDADVMFHNPPEDTDSDDLHYNSLSLVIEFGDTSFLFTGDAERDAEERMIEDWTDELDVDVYQAGHHGSSTSSTSVFMDAVSPSIAVISSAYDSQYGHPHDEVLDRFADRAYETYWTGVHGTIVITSDGESISANPEHDEPTDAEELKAMKPNDNTDSMVAPPIALAVG